MSAARGLTTPAASSPTTPAPALHPPVWTRPTEEVASTPLLTRERVEALESELDRGQAVPALRRFNDNLAKLDPSTWRATLRPVFNELAHDLETFNPAFTATVLKVQMTIGESDYERRDAALQNLIQPLAGEYGLTIGQPLLKTHRRLFSDWYRSVMGEELSTLLAEGVAPQHSLRLFDRMMTDITTGGGHEGSMAQAAYAMGYNLAIEYLADYEKTWALDAMRSLDDRVLKVQGIGPVDYLFLEVHAEHECEHAAIGHAAVLAVVEARHEEIVREAMIKHDADLATFYNALADMLEEKK